METSFKALWLNNSNSDPDQTGQIKAQIRETKIEELTQGDLVIKTKYSAINYKDALAVTGKGKILRKLPLIPGIDLSGVVVRSNSPRFKEGDPVLAMGYNVGESYCGGFSQYARLPDQVVFHQPKNLDSRESAIMGTAGLTATIAIDQMEKNGLTPDQGAVLVTGSCGGVGVLALSFLSRLGYRAEAWTRRRENENWLKSFGADKVTDISQKDFSSHPLESPLWAGAIDNLGGEPLSHIIARMKLWSSVAVIGLAKSHQLKTTLFPLILRGVKLLGISSNNCPRELKKQLLEKMASTMKPENLDSMIFKEIFLEGLVEACHQVIGGRHRGRILVKF